MKVNIQNIDFILKYQACNFIKWQKTKQDADMKTNELHIMENYLRKLLDHILR